MKHSQGIKILVVDYHNIVCSGIAAVLRGYTDFIIVGHAHTVEAALRLCEKHRPDVVTLDVGLPDTVNGINLIHQIRSMFQNIRIVVLTNIAELETIHEVLQAGVTSYLLKNVSVDEHAHAIRAAHQGQSTLSQEITQLLVRAFITPTPGMRDLTQREQQVLDLITQGQTNQEIAHQLSISLSTVQFHVRNILAKLGVHNRIEAATLAIRQEFNHHSTWSVSNPTHTVF